MLAPSGEPHASAFAQPPPYAALTIGRDERLLIVSPHPDDETLGAAGLTQRVLAQGGRVHSVIVTAGDGFTEAVQARTGAASPTPDMYLALGSARIREAHQAAQQLGRGRVQLSVLGFPDGALTPLLGEHWHAARPLRSPLTRVSAVPYRALPTRLAAYSGSRLHQQLTAAVRSLRPTLVAFSDPIDEHPDHASVGIFTLRALAAVFGESDVEWPRLLAYLVHWRAWPPDSADSGNAPDAAQRSLQLPADLPARGHTQVCLSLDATELQRKQAALQVYATQLAVTPAYLRSFVRRTECFSQVTPQSARVASAAIGVSSQ
ncbi:MAG: PIG-L family deacetylase [Polyangiales bacterium]